MTILLVRHRVADFDSWKRAYDADAPGRRKAGLTDLHLLRTKDDPNDVVLLFKTADLATARKRMESEELRKLMKDAGVIGAAQFTYLDEPSDVREAAASSAQPAIH